jgi:hypothetical protein
LGLDFVERPNRFGAAGHLSGIIDGLEVTVRKQGHGEGTVTGITIEFPDRIGPPGLLLKRVRKHYRGRPAVGRRTRFGWLLYTGSFERRAVLAKADDPEELELWMTVDRIEALLGLAVRGRDVLVTRDHVWCYRTGKKGGLGGSPASSQAIIEEVRRVLPLARRLL